MKEITKEQAKELKTGTEYIVFNPLTNDYRKIIASPIDIVHNKYCYDKLKFYLEEETDDNRRVKKIE